jgi:hypothetical protein
MINFWKCEFCGQQVELHHGRPKLPQEYFENCKLKDYFIGDECIAFRDPERARLLLTEGELHRIEQMQSEGRKLPKLVKQGMLPSLVKEFMDKRPPDRELYSITVGTKVYWPRDIEQLHKRLG